MFKGVLTMCLKTPRIILASKSPRRQELLKTLGFEFIIHAPDVDENIEGIPENMVKILSERKARAVADEYSTGLIIAADTLVSLDNRALGKPSDEEDAMRMLKSFSGRAHQVYTGICLMNAETKAFEVKAVRSDVHFRPLSLSEILAYIETKEPMDKAGAYAIQGGAGKFIEKYEGSYTNIVGFPTEEFSSMYERFSKSFTEEK